MTRFAQLPVIRSNFLLIRSAPLMRKFLSSNYQAELNSSKVMGYGGELAKAFGSLMQKLWQVHCSCDACWAVQHLTLRCS